MYLNLYSLRFIVQISSYIGITTAFTRIIIFLNSKNILKFVILFAFVSLLFSNNNNIKKINILKFLKYV